MARRPRTFTVEAAGLPVEVSRRRTRRLTLRAAPTGEVFLSVPLSWDEASAAAWLRGPGAAPLARVLSRLPSPAVRESLAAYGRLAEGDRVEVWGVPHTVAFADGAARPAVRVGAGRVVFSGADPTGAGREERRRLFEEALREELADRLDAVRRMAEAATETTTTRWGVRRMHTRWGSCRYETGRVSVSLDLATHDPECLAMVAVHEACHMRVHDHGPAFEALMDEAFPRWREVDARLDAEGVRLPRRPPGPRGAA